MGGRSRSQHAATMRNTLSQTISTAAKPDPGAVRGGRATSRSRMGVSPGRDSVDAGITMSSPLRDQDDPEFVLYARRQPRHQVGGDRTGRLRWAVGQRQIERVARVDVLDVVPVE